MSPIIKDTKLSEVTVSDVDTQTVEKDDKVETQEYPILQTMSEEDAYISDRMKSQPTTLDEVRAVKEKKYLPGEHRLSLPKEFKKYKDRFAFRWINKKKRADNQGLGNC